MRSDFDSFLHVSCFGHLAFGAARLFKLSLRPRPGKKGPKSAISGVGPNGQNVGKKSPDWEIRASRPLPITNIRTATAGFPAAFLGPELDSGKQGFERGGRHTYAWR